MSRRHLRRVGLPILALSLAALISPAAVSAAPPPFPPDVIVGTPDPDTLLGGPGPDTIRGGQGVDRIAGGHGNDLILVAGDGEIRP